MYQFAGGGGLSSNWEDSTLEVFFHSFSVFIVVDDDVLKESSCTSVCVWSP